MVRHLGGNGMQPGQFSRCDQLSMRAVRSSSVLFMECLRNFCFIGRLPGSDGHHLKPIPADFKFGARRPEDGMIITETGLMY